MIALVEVNLIVNKPAFNKFSAVGVTVFSNGFVKEDITRWLPKGRQG